MNTHLQQKNGFTLVELLAVVAIILLLAGLSVVSLRGTFSSSNLSSGGSQLAGYLDMARQTAVTNRSPVAVILLSSGESSANRVFATLQFQSESETWMRISKWEKLPTGVVMDTDDPNNLNAFLPLKSPALSSPLPTQEYGGTHFAPREATGYGYIVFLPDGSLHVTSKPCVLRLVEGVPSASGPVLTGAKDAQGKPANFFEIVIIDTTGGVKTNRPH